MVSLAANLLCNKVGVCQKGLYPATRLKCIMRPQPRGLRFSRHITLFTGGDTVGEHVYSRRGIHVDLFFRLRLGLPAASSQHLQSYGVRLWTHNSVTTRL